MTGSWVLHGTVEGYRKSACRCDRCTAAASLARTLERRAAKKRGKK